MNATVRILAALFAFVTLAACRDGDERKPTGLVVRLWTDMPSDLKSLRLVVTGAGKSSALNQTYELAPEVPGSIRLPYSIALYPSPEGEAPIDIDVVGYPEVQLGGTPIVWRRATLQFVRDQVLVLDMPLLAVCKGVPCDESTTCRERGVCESRVVDKSTLLPYRPGQLLVIPDAAAGGRGGTDAGGARDATVDAPLADAAPEPVRRPLLQESLGSRVGVAGYRSADGFALPGDTYYDRMRNAPCYPYPAADGKIRCLPSSLIASPAYADRLCEIPVTTVNKAHCGDRSVALVSVFGSCPTRYRVVQVGLVQPSVRAVYARQGETGCRGVTTMVNPNEDVYALGMEIPATSFPEVIEMVSDASPTLAARFHVTTDGARLLAGFRDKAEGWDCTFKPTRAGARCLPTDVGVVLGGQFADPACMVRAATGNSAPCPPTPFAVEYGAGGSCTESAELTHYRSTRASSATYYRPGGGDCTSLGTPAQYGVGPVVPLIRFAAADAEVPVPGTRLVRERLGHGQLAINTDVRDTELGLRCSPQLAADGKTRCLPSQMGIVGGYFADDRCTQRIALAGCTPYVSQNVSPGTCPAAGTRIYAAGAEHTGKFYFMNLGTCMEQSTPPGGRYVTLGAEVPASRFVELTPAVLP